MTENARPRRYRECAEAFGVTGEYDPACCRFPKSCSPYPYQEAIDAGNVADADLEPAAAGAGRYAYCDDTCTADCGHCKGAGRPAPLSGGDARTQLARTLYAHHHDPDEPFEQVSESYLSAADALLPVVERIADERAAEALEALAAIAKPASGLLREINHRAASLRATSRGDQT